MVINQPHRMTIYGKLFAVSVIPPVVCIVGILQISAASAPWEKYAPIRF